MSLRVFDDERPGFALLAFSGAHEQATLSLSVRSLREGTFLGPRGKWQKAPHYFSAQRVNTEHGATLFRVGPEIVNYLLEHDRIEVATEDGSLIEETLWENAVPQLPGESSGYAIYRPPPARPSAPPSTFVSSSGGAQDTRAASPPQPAPPGPPEADTTTPPPPPPPQIGPRTQRPGSPPSDPGPNIQTVVQPDPPVWRKFIIPLAVLLAIGGAVAALPSLRCKLFGVSCEAPPAPNPADGLLTTALACAAAKRTPAPCEVEACFNAYLAATPADKVAANARSAIDDAKNACRLRQAQENDQAEKRRRAAAEAAALKAARECAGKKKPDTAAMCSVRSCYSAYLSEFGASGTLRDQAFAEIAQAEQACRRATAPPPVPEGAYNAAALRSGCAPAQFGIRVDVRGNTISWRHELNGAPYAWSGTIDAQGTIRAAVGNSRDMVATGRYSDEAREVRMSYPQCRGEPITLSILGRL